MQSASVINSVKSSKKPADLLCVRKSTADTISEDLILSMYKESGIVPPLATQKTAVGVDLQNIFGYFENSVSDREFRRVRSEDIE